MRTTLTLDEDVFERLTEEARKTGKPFKAVVNEALRTGLNRKPAQAKKRFVWRDIGLSTGMEFGSTSELIERLDGPAGR